MFKQNSDHLTQRPLDGYPGATVALENIRGKAIGIKDPILAAFDLQIATRDARAVIATRRFAGVAAPSSVERFENVLADIDNRFVPGDVSNLLRLTQEGSFDAPTSAYAVALSLRLAERDVQNGLVSGASRKIDEIRDTTHSQAEALISDLNARRDAAIALTTIDGLTLLSNADRETYRAYYLETLEARPEFEKELREQGVEEGEIDLVTRAQFAMMRLDSSPTAESVHTLVAGDIARDRVRRDELIGQLLADRDFLTSLGSMEPTMRMNIVLALASSPDGDESQSARSLLSAITPDYTGAELVVGGVARFGKRFQIVTGGEGYSIHDLSRRWLVDIADGLTKRGTQLESLLGRDTLQFILWSQLNRNGLIGAGEDHGPIQKLRPTNADELRRVFDLLTSSSPSGAIGNPLLQRGVLEGVAELTSLSQRDLAIQTTLYKNGHQSGLSKRLEAARGHWRSQLMRHPQKHIVALAVAFASADTYFSFEGKDADTLSDTTRDRLTLAFDMALEQSFTMTDPTVDSMYPVDIDNRYAVIATDMARVIASEVPGGLAVEFMDRVAGWFDQNPRRTGIALTNEMTDVVEALFQDNYGDRFTPDQRANMQQQLVNLLGNIEGRVFANPGEAVDQFVQGDTVVVSLFDNMFRLLSLLPNANNNSPEQGSLELDGKAKNPIGIHTTQLTGEMIPSAAEASIIFTAGLAEAITASVSASGRGFEIADVDSSLRASGIDDFAYQIKGSSDIDEIARLKRLQIQHSHRPSRDEVDLTAEFADVTSIGRQVAGIQSITNRYRRNGYNCRIVGDLGLNNFRLDWQISDNRSRRIVGETQ